MAMLKHQRVHDKWYTKGIAAASRLWPQRAMRLEEIQLKQTTGPLAA